MEAEQPIVDGSLWNVEESSDIATCMLHIKAEFNPFILAVETRWRKEDFNDINDYLYKYVNQRDKNGHLVRELEDKSYEAEHSLRKLNECKFAKKQSIRKMTNAGLAISVIKMIKRLKERHDQETQ